MYPNMGAAESDRDGEKPPEHSETRGSSTQGERSNSCRAGVATRKRRGRGASNPHRRVTVICGSLASEDPLDALIDDEALEPDQGGKSNNVVRATRRNATYEADQMPNQAPVTRLAGGDHHGINSWDSTNAIEQLIGVRIELLDQHAELVDTTGCGELRLHAVGPARASGASDVALVGSPPNSGHQG